MSTGRPPEHIPAASLIPGWPDPDPRSATSAQLHAEGLHYLATAARLVRPSQPPADAASAQAYAALAQGHFLAALSSAAVMSGSGEDSAVRPVGEPEVSAFLEGLISSEYAEVGIPEIEHTRAVLAMLARLRGLDHGSGPAAG